MMLNKSDIRLFFPVGATVLHAIFFTVTFNLAMAEHRQTGQGGQQGGDAEIFVAFAELFNGGRFVRIVHEIDVAL